MKKVIIIGGGPAGITAAKILLSSSDYSVSIFERDKRIGFMNELFPQWLSKRVDDASVFSTNAEQMQALGATVYGETEVLEVDHINKTVSARKATGEQFVEQYDSLILATGSRPSQFPVSGINLKGIHFVRLYENAKDCVEQFMTHHIKRVAIIGGNYIGVKLAEACRDIGCEVIVIDPGQLLASQYGRPFADRIEAVLRERGVEIKTGRLQRFIGNEGRVTHVVTSTGTHEVDFVMLNVGFYPVSSLCEHAARTERAAYRVTYDQLTTLPDIYAVGDCAAGYDPLVGDHISVFLSSEAVRSGTIAALHIMGKKIDFNYSQRARALKVGDLYVAAAGITTSEAKFRQIDINFSDISGRQFYPFMNLPDHEVLLRLIYRKNNRQLIGAQMLSKHDITEHIKYYAFAIQQGMTINELTFCDTFFAPHFNQAYNYHMLCALAAP